MPVIQRSDRKKDEGVPRTWFTDAGITWGCARIELDALL